MEGAFFDLAQIAAADLCLIGEIILRKAFRIPYTLADLAERQGEARSVACSFVFCG